MGACPWMRAACCLAEGEVWWLPHCKAHCYIAIKWRKKREVKAEVGLKLLLSSCKKGGTQSCPRTGGGRAPSPLPLPVGRRKKRGTLQRETLNYSKGSSPLGLQDQLLSEVFVAP